MAALPGWRMQPNFLAECSAASALLTRPAASGNRPVAGSKSRCFVPPPGHMTEQVHRQRKDHGRGSLAGNVVQRREVAQLHRLRLLRKRSASLDKLLGGLLLAHRIDHLGAPQPLRLGLFGNRPHHGFIEIDILDLYGGDLDAPDVGLLIENFLDVRVKPVPFGEHLVQFVLAEHRAKRGLRQLAGRGHVIADLDDRALGIDDAEVKNGIDLDRNIVARNHVLRRHDLYHHPEIDLHHLLYERDQDDQSRALHAGEAAEREYDAALVFAQDANGRGQKQHHDDHEHPISQIIKHHHVPPSGAVSTGWRRTTSVKPLMLATSTTSPGLKASVPRACQRSPWAKTWPSLSDQSRISADRPRMACAPRRTGPLWARRSEPRTTRIRPMKIAAVMPITGHDSRNPGASSSNNITAPRTNATIPPRPRTTVGLKTSMTRSVVPNRIRPRPA